MKYRLSDILRNLKHNPYRSDVLAILLLTAISLYLTRPLLHLNSRVLWSDLSVSWAWLYWLKESIFTFHQFPTWSPLWMGGMPYFGMVPPAGFFFALPLYLLTGSAPAAYNLGMIMMSCLSGASMYLYLKYISRNSLVSLLGAVIYLVLPVKSSAFMVHGMFELLCGYAAAPLVLLFTERFLDNRRGLDLIFLSLFLSFIALVQIEHSLLFLVFFYLPYAVFSLCLKKVGVRQLLTFIRENKACCTAVAFIIIIAISFYVPLLTERGDFKGLLPEEIEAGLNFYTFHHFSDTFTAKANDVLDTFYRPETEHYSGPLALVILLTATFFLVQDRRRTGTRTAQLLFFLIMAMGLLILSMGIYGPLFPVARTALPVLADMRVTLRFYPFFAICLPVLLVLSYPSFSKLVVRIPKLPIQAKTLMSCGVAVLLVIGLVLDFVPYFDFYHYRVVNRQEMYEYSSFLKNNWAEKSSVGGNIARVLIYPLLGTNMDPISSIDETDTGQFTIEIAQTVLPWDQYKDAVDYYHSVCESITDSRDTLSFFSNLMSIDYILVYRNKVPPISGEEYIDQKVKALDSLCGSTASPLIYKGSLNNHYYTIYLYEVGDVSSRVKFYPIESSVIVPSDDPLISVQLFGTYSTLPYPVSARTFLDRVVTISTDVGSIEDSSLTLATMDSIPWRLYLKTSTPSERDTQIGEVALTAKGLSFDVGAKEDGILSLTYYYNPWWKAYVDGRESPVLRVNGILAGTYVSEGQHHIEFVYDYPSLPNVISRLWR